VFKLLTTVSARELRHSPLRASLVVGGIAAGVALLTGINVVNHAVTDHLRHSAGALAGHTNLQVIAPGGEQRLDASLASRLADIDGVAVASAVIDTVVPLADRPAHQRVFAADFGDARLPAVYGIRLAASGDPATLLAERGATIATPGITAEPATAGASVRLAGETGTADLTLVGRLAPDSAFAIAGRDVLILDIVEAQVLLGLGDVADRIDVVISPAADIDTVAAMLRREIGPGLDVVTRAELGTYFATSVHPFQMTLQAFGMLGLVAGVFMVYGATSTAVRARGRAIGTLRAVGVTPRQIVAMLFAEATLLGMAASLLGALGGYFLAFALSDLVRDTMSMVFFYPFPAGSPALGIAHVSAAMLAGTTAAVAGATVPALRAVRLEPIAAMTEEPGSMIYAAAPPRRLVWMAAGLALLVAAAIPFEVRLKSAAIGNFASITWFVAFVLFSVPAVAWLASRCIPLLERVFGVTGLIAGENLAVSARRSAVAVAALALAVATQITFAGLIHSFETSVHTYVEHFMKADLVVSSAHSGGGWLEEPIGAFLLAHISSVEGVERVGAFRFLPGQRLGNQRISVLAGTRSFFEPEAYARWFVEGDPVAALAKVREGRAVLVSQTLAHLSDIGVGDELALSTPGGRLVLPVAGVVVDYTSDRGSVILESATFSRYWNDTHVSRILVHIEPGAQRAAVRERILSVLGDREAFRVADLEEVVAFQKRELDESFQPTGVIELFMIIVTIAGIIDAVAANVSERRREFGLMRATGATAAQLERTIMAEAAVMILAGLTLGVAGGTVSSWMWVNFHATYFLGWIIDFHFPWETAARACGLAAAAAVAAAYIPARIAARGDVLTAMRYQ
jgi:putative ABC transport system permease protein